MTNTNASQIVRNFDRLDTEAQAATAFWARAIAPVALTDDYPFDLSDVVACRASGDLILIDVRAVAFV